MQEKTRQSDGNAIIGMDIDYTTFANDVIGVVASGTAVQIKKVVRSEILPYSIPVMSQNVKLPFNITNINLKSNVFSGITLANLNMTNYDDGKIMKAMIVDLELEDIFQNVSIIPNLIFIFKSSETETEYVKISLEDVNLDFIDKAYVTVKKILVKGERKATDIDTASASKNMEMTNEELGRIRKIKGEDVANEFQVNENEWICYCGAHNEKTNNICYRCKRTLNELQRNAVYVQPNNISAGNILSQIENMVNAREICEYIERLEMPELDLLVEELHVLAKTERLYGNMKTSAVKKVTDFFTNNKSNQFDDVSK